MKRKSTLIKRCTVYYTSRDTIIYAFGIGCNSADDEKELRYLYEHNVPFSVFPTFLLTLLFRAVPTNPFEKSEDQIIKEDNHEILHMFGMPVFPPPSMVLHPITTDSFACSSGRHPNTNSTGCCQKNTTSTMIHLGQRLWIQSQIPNGCAKPVKVDIESRLISIRPYQQKGAIAVTESKFYDTTSTCNKLLIATSQMTVLFLSKAAPVSCSAFSSPSMFPTVQIPKLVLEKTKESEQPFVQRYYISSNQALLYRLSGDTNRIHVEGTRGEDLFPTKQPIMHGLCVLGYAARAVLRTFVNSDDNEECNYIDCRFTLPLPVGEDIEVRMWQVDEQSMKGIILPEEGTRLIVFEVVSVKTELVVVDGGIAGIVLRKEIPSQVVKGKQTMQKQSKL